ncbi:MAG TPA: response regulator [Candidatus Limnocylindria bacterium]
MRTERILIVDDQPQNRRLLEGMLSPYGYFVTAASSGDDALAKMKAEPPDLIVLDVVMPGMSGYDVARAVRADPATRIVPIIMVTANPEQDKIAAIDAGADDFIVEPLDKQELLARIRSLLRMKAFHDTVHRQAAELAELNRTLQQRVESQVLEILALRGLGGTAMFRLEGEFWTIAFEGAAFRLKDTKGLRYISCLIRNAGREIHALELAASPGGIEDDATPLGSDAGPVLDTEAKAQYKARLDELDIDIAEAERWNDCERAAREREEREVIIHELAGAVGLGGRDRKAASDAERARVNVTRAIKAVLERIADHSPALATHFDAALHTGTFCSYMPDPRVALRWEL